MGSPCEQGELGGWPRLAVDARPTEVRGGRSTASEIRRSSSARASCHRCADPRRRTGIFLRYESLQRHYRLITERRLRAIRGSHRAVIEFSLHAPSSRASKYPLACRGPSQLSEARRLPKSLAVAGRENRFISERGSGDPHGDFTCAPAARSFISREPVHHTRSRTRSSPAAQEDPCKKSRDTGS